MIPPKCAGIVVEHQIQHLTPVSALFGRLSIKVDVFVSRIAGITALSLTSSLFSHHGRPRTRSTSGSIGRLGVVMLTLKRPSPTMAAVILVIAGTASSAILAGAWYYLESWHFLLIVVLLALFGDDLLALFLLSVKSEDVALTGKEAMIGRIATVVSGFASVEGSRRVCGKVRLNGEFWFAQADCEQCDRLAVGRKVRIRSVEGLTLIVEPE